MYASTVAAPLSPLMDCFRTLGLLACIAQVILPVLRDTTTKNDKGHNLHGLRNRLQGANPAAFP
jgi:hypothetical protein